jgi:hypothetical protein
MSRVVSFPPLMNGLDFLEDAVERLRGAPNDKDLKYAVLHLHAGVEVLLKYRLICHDWHLVLADSSAATTEDEYNNGQFRSIGVGEALKRLQTLDGIKFSKSQKKAAAAVEKFRNQLQHHGLTSAKEAVEAQSAKALAFILDFIDNHIRPESSFAQADEEFLDETLPGIRTGLREITGFVDHRMDRISSALKFVPPTWCTDCGQPAVLLESYGFAPPVGILAHSEPRCAFCTRRWTSRKDYVDDFIFSGGLSLYEVSKGGEPPTEPCPECGEDMVVWFDPDTGDLSASVRFSRCFNCDAEFNDRCGRCFQPVTAEAGDEGTVCSDCWSQIAND